MGVTRDLVRFVANARYEDLSPDAIAATKSCILNILGCCIAGSQTRIGRLQIEMAKEIGGGREAATIIGEGSKVSVPAAAFANGNLAFALDYEDTLRYITHPGFVTISSGLAVGEAHGFSGRDLILGTALGYEVLGRIGPAMQPTAARGKQVWGEQYHPFAGTVTAGKMLGLDEEALDVAFGIAGTYASVPSAYKYFGVVAETRPLREVKLGWGWMTMAGTMGALSAHKGFRGGTGVLDGERGFHVMAGSDRCDFEAITRGLGQGWMIVDTEYKIYPSIARNHPAYHALRSLAEENAVGPGDVERIRVRGMQMRLVDDFNPQSAVDAQFSLPFAAVMGVLRQRLTPAMFSDERLFDAQVRGLLARVHLEHDAAADEIFFNEQRLCFSVAIELKDGRTLARDIEFPRDQPRMDWAALGTKFRTLAEGTLTPARIEQVIEMVAGIDKLGDLKPLLEAVRGTSS